MIFSSVLPEHILVQRSNVGSSPVLPAHVGCNPLSSLKHSIAFQTLFQPYSLRVCFVPQVSGVFFPHKATCCIRTLSTLLPPPVMYFPHLHLSIPSSMVFSQMMPPHSFRSDHSSSQLIFHGAFYFLWCLLTGT